MILNFCSAASITYHDSLHGFQSVCGMRTALIEVKLLQKVMDMREEALYIILLDLQKVYDDLERSRFLDILEGYGVGTRDLSLL